MRFGLSILLSLILISVASGQTDTTKQKNDTLPGRFYLLQKVKRDGETLPEIEIKEVRVLGRQKGVEGRRTLSHYRKYERLVYNLKRAYPYAMIVRIRLDQVNQDLSEITDEKERRKYIRDFEKDVFGEYEDDMRDMTITQGRLLIKLIDRETQNTSYELIKQYRGGLTAAFWQGIARIFGSNLKDEYDPYGEDLLIELIVQEIETGRL
ncbi:MAG: DUF4294 domain-containing protein [Bacteroidales bacterium]|nr:DUF4294 domain-containing protein [Bacteroidales bacterium]